MNESEYLNTRLSGLSPAKRALLEKRLRGESTGCDSSAVILPRPDQTTYPLSFAQERFWLFDRLEPGSPATNRPFALHISGRLAVPVLERTLAEISRRHSVLRATFSEVDGKPVQQIGPVEPIRLVVTDLSDMSAAEQGTSMRALVVAESRRPFDLVRGPLLRGTLYRLAEQEHILLLVIHHISFDAWSAKVFMREMAVLHDAFLEGRASPLPELPVQYADFALWQRQWFRQDRLDGLLAYWQEHLHGAPASLDLPAQGRQSLTSSYQGRSHRLDLPAVLVASLRDLSREKGVTLFVTLFAAFNVLLHRYTGQDDMVIGVPVAGRTHTEAENMIGFFINTLVLRTDLSGNPPFTSLLERVRETALGGLAHQDLPFEKLVQALQPDRAAGRSPLFQVMFNLENVPEQPALSQTLDIEDFEFDSGIQYYDLTLEIIEQDGGLSCQFGCRTDLFADFFLQNLAGHFHTLLEDISVHPERPIAVLELLTEAEQDRILYQWNDTRKDFSSQSCIHHLFEAQVERTPEAIAVQHEDQTLTYRELNSRANQVAHILQESGVGPEVLVGLCVERSVEMLVGLFGILKAGGAYVPLDPAYPPERLAFMMEDSRAHIYLTQRRFVEMFPREGARILCLEDEWKTIACENTSNPPSEVKPGHLAYVIYTSGSTGRPKGVMIEHRSLVNHTEAVGKKYAVIPGDRFLQFASLSFDFSADEIYTCLAHGATLVLRTDSMLDSIQCFLQKCREWSVTILDLPASFWHEIITTLALDGETIPPSVRLIVIGAEKVIPDKLRWWLEHVGGRVRLLNGYGPTETTVTVSKWEAPGSAMAANVWQEVPIGRPFQNTQMYIFDRYMQPVPIGVAGEIHIGGLGLARGYLNRPELTEEKFVPNPFRREPGSRLYKTGDRGRYLPDGTIEFLGRTDHQIKIRGFRIEPGEIEAVLMRHPAIQEAAVVPRADRSGEIRLVAYVVFYREAHLSSNELRQFLEDELPRFMIPSAVVELEALPRTANGKLDRQALPEPDDSRPDLKKSAATPRTPLEEILAGIWSEILGVSQIGIHDNFFDLGGHSLLAMRIVSRMRRDLQIEWPLRSLFEAPTVAQLAAGLENLTRTDIVPSPIRPVLREKYRRKSPQGEEPPQ